MTDNEITQKTIDLLDKLDETIVHRQYGDRFEELDGIAAELRKMIEIAEIDKVVMKGIK